MIDATPENPQPKNPYIRSFLLAFAAFDIIHLLCAIVLIVIAYTSRPISAMEAAECMVEIVLSILLICFINAMQHHHKYLDHPQITYTLGYLTASASLFVPLSFSLPEVIEGDWTGSYVTAMILVVSCLIIAFLAFLSFFLSLISVHSGNIWRLLVIIGLCMMIILVPVQFAMEFFIQESPVVLTFHLLKAFAPMVFAPLGIYLVAGNKSRSVFFRDLN